jgi:hypothetical protein
MQGAQANVLTRGPARARLEHLVRILQVYARPKQGPLSFWHEDPEINEAYRQDPRAYFMRFRGKANYAGPFDENGIPLLDYRGRIGRQHNPIAIAQYGLARFNRWCESGAGLDRTAWLAASRWLAEGLTPNGHGVPVWLHHFDWPYRQLLRAPWYSGLAQGSGLSMLVRAAAETGEPVFGEAAHRAFVSLERPADEGGVLAIDANGDVWIEEYIVTPPSHILNGFIWALWGVLDYARWSGKHSATALWDSCVKTLRAHVHEFDIGWWSLYETRHAEHRMLASLYYHRLHAVQLRVLHDLTGIDAFADCAARFEVYARQPLLRGRAFVEKAWFKVRRY